MIYLPLSLSIYLYLYLSLSIYIYIYIYPRASRHPTPLVAACGASHLRSAQTKQTQINEISKSTTT